MLKFEKLERKLYDKTCDQPYFTADDIRRFKLMRYFDSPNQVGWFFRAMSERGHTSSTEAVPSEHKEAKGRLVKAWVWEIVYGKAA